MWALEMQVDDTGTVQQHGQIIYCRPGQLKRHPENMRRFYPADDVQAMGQSIKAARGVHQALLVVPNGTGDTYIVVDGNMRLAGARALGDECPLLKCEVIAASHAEQLLLMATTSRQHYPKDPISEGLHYELLVKEGFTIPDIADAVGCHPRTIESRMHLLKLDEPIRKHIAAGGLSKDMRFADAIMAIPDKATRIALAGKLAARKAGLKQCLAACEKVASDIGISREKKKVAVALADKKMITALVAQMVAHFRRDAAMFRAAALVIGEHNPEIANGLLDRAEELYRLIDTAIGRGNGKHN